MGGKGKEFGERQKEGRWTHRRAKRENERERERERLEAPGGPEKSANDAGGALGEEEVDSVIPNVCVCV